MTRRTGKLYRCDRCGRVVGSESLPPSWAELILTHDGITETLDICVVCLTKLETFIFNPRSDENPN